MPDNTLEFARPWLLLAGAVVCLVAGLLFVVFDRRRMRDLARLVHPRFLQRLVAGFSPALQWTKRGLWLLAVLLLFTAAAGPRKGYEWREVKRRGIDLLFAVDTSRSMLAQDLTPDRLERARMGILDFVSRLQGDRIGLIPFAGSAYALCPLTLDYDAFRESLHALDTDLIPKQGTDIASAIREAERLFEEQGNNHRILILITDGEDLQGDVFEAATEAAKKGMVIYTVGVGSADGVTIPLRLANGSTDFVRDSSGAYVKTRLDEAGLQRIADATGGLYVPLGRGAEGLNTLYQEKLRLVPQEERDSKMEKIPLERYEWPLGAALLLLLMEFLLPTRLRGAAARTLPSAARRRTVPAAVLTVGLLALTSPGQVAAADPRELYNEGTEAYNAGEYDKAADSLRSSLNTSDLALQNRTYYNLGNTLYQLGKTTLQEKPDDTIKTWEESLTAYESALALDNSDADARFNRDVVKRKLDALKKQRNKEDPKDDQKGKDDKKDQEQKDKKDGKDQKQDGGDKSQDKDKSEDQQQKDKDGKDAQSGQDEPQKDKDGKDAQSGQDQQQKDKDGKDAQSGQDEPQKDKDGKDAQSGQDEQQKDKGGKDQAQKPGEEKKGEEGEKKDGAEAGKPGEKKPGEEGKPEGEAADESKDGKKAETADISEERRKPGEMSREEAKQLLQSLRSDERTVIPIERPDPRMRRFLDPNNTTKGKTW